MSGFDLSGIDNTMTVRLTTGPRQLDADAIGRAGSEPIWSASPDATITHAMIYTAKPEPRTPRWLRRLVCRIRGHQRPWVKVGGDFPVYVQCFRCRR